MIKDDAWPVARLIPISSASGVEAQERRAASALLAVIAAVPEFGRSLLKPLGVSAGKIETFIEVPFKLADGRSIRPDGLIVITRGGKSWGSVVETKVGSASLEKDQIDAYLDLARELEFDAVLSISNHYVTSSFAYPIEVDKRKIKKVALHHWSWIDVLTEAVLQKKYRGVSDPDQAYILNELIRYLSDPRSGVVSFGSMGSSWTKVKDGAREHTLRRTDPDVAEIAGRWDDLIRYLALDLTKDLGREVRQVLPKEERTPAARHTALRESLSETGRLYADVQVPDVAGVMHIVADLRSRQISVSTELDAPKEGRSKGRVSWLIRQLQNAPDSLTVQAKVARSQSSLAASLAEVRSVPEILYPDQQKEIRQFVLTLTQNMGLKRDAGKGSFIDSVISTTKEFYGEVLQNLRPWKARPPKLQKQPTTGEPSEGAELPPKVEEALQVAQSEQAEDAQTPEVSRP